jgi:hypothetical protein
MQLKFDILSLLSVNAVIIYLKIRKNSPTNLPEITREQIGFLGERVLLPSTPPPSPQSLRPWMDLPYHLYSTLHV